MSTSLGNGVNVPVLCAPGPRTRRPRKALVMSHSRSVAVFSAGPGGPGDAIADELAHALRRLDVPAQRYVLGDRGGPPWTLATEAAVARAVGPDVGAVVSTSAQASQVLGRLRGWGTIAVPVVTYLADAAVHPLAVADGVDIHLAAHHETARQGRALGAADVRVVAPPVRPSFVDAGGDATGFDLPAGRIVRTSREIAATGLATPVIACGGDQLLRLRLARAGVGIALSRAGDLPALVRISDVVVQNGGDQVCLEALSAGVPVLSYRCVPGPGRANAAALEQAGLAPWIRYAEDLAPALERAFDLPVPRVDTVGQSAAEVIAAVAGRPAAGSGQTLPVRRIIARHTRPAVVPALAYTVM
jgi:hypothetical protein